MLDTDRTDAMGAATVATRDTVAAAVNVAAALRTRAANCNVATPSVTDVCGATAKKTAGHRPVRASRMSKVARDEAKGMRGNRRSTDDKHSLSAETHGAMPGVALREACATDVGALLARANRRMVRRDTVSTTNEDRVA